MTFRILSFIAALLVFISCEKVDFELEEIADDFFFLENNGAEMPVWVQGNTKSKKMLIMLHGGPGGSTFVFDAFFKEFTDPLEEEFGVVYWEQRSSGTAQGNFSSDDLTTEQYEEDLSKLLDLLQFQYGLEVEYYLVGLSWGGYLGSSWLINSGRQDQVAGWINLVGPSDFLEIGNIGRDRLAAFAPEQIESGKYQELWEEILDWCNEHPTVEVLEDFMDENRYANIAGTLINDSLTIQTEPANIGVQLSYAFTGPFNSNAWLANRRSINASELINSLLSRPLDCSTITLPTRIIGGHFDFVVPEEHLQNQFEQLGAIDKSIHILPKSSHSVIAQEVDQVIEIIFGLVK